MEILRHGRNRDKQFKCVYCDCEYVANPTEYELSTNILETGVYEVMAICKCPECRMINWGKIEEIR